MENNNISTLAATTSDWYSEEFISSSVMRYLKECGYKVQRESRVKDDEKSEILLIASKFFKKEIIEVKGFPQNFPNPLQAAVPKATHAKNWFSEAMFNSFVNFSSFENAEIAMALPNVGRYRAIIEKLNEYFTVNDLYFRIYLVNEDGSVDVSNLNDQHLKQVL
jgi:hypothetical protein